jgi:hypothetical protein
VDKQHPKLNFNINSFESELNTSFEDMLTPRFNLKTYEEDKDYISNSFSEADEDGEVVYTLDKSQWVN